MEPGEADRMDVTEGYHGTVHGLIGDRLTPSISGTRNRSPLSRQDVVNWYGRAGMPKEMEERAWRLGRGSDLQPTEEDPSAGRARVHVGSGAGGPVGADPNLGTNAKLAQRFANPKQMTEYGMAMAAPAFQVGSTNWAPPPSNRAAKLGVGVQAALGGMNWHQFGAPNIANPMDTTNPDKRDVALASPANQRPTGLPGPTKPAGPVGPESAQAVQTGQMSLF
jgi:hypothetical protein